MNLNTIQKQRLIQSFPELKGFFEQQRTQKLLEDVKAQSDDQFKAFLNLLVEKIKTLKGEKGDTGYTPQKGKDYFTNQEINALAEYVKSVTKKEVTPVKGKDYFDGDNYILTKKDKQEIADSIKVPIVEKVIEKTEVIKHIMPELDVSMVKDAASKKDLLSGIQKIDGRFKLIDQRWHGAGLSKVSTDATLTGTGTSSNPLSVVGGGGGFTVLSATGTVNGSNQIFTFTQVPTFLVVDGAFYQKTDNNGVVQWSSSGLTITTLITPSNSIFGIA